MPLIEIISNWSSQRLNWNWKFCFFTSKMAQKIIEPVYLMARGLKRFTATHSITFFPLLRVPSPHYVALIFALALRCFNLWCTICESSGYTYNTSRVVKSADSKNIGFCPCYVLHTLLTLICNSNLDDIIVTLFKTARRAVKVCSTSQNFVTQSDTI